ncbi:plasminogen-like [Gigantopelta aegis]|uniref:plasminogen-like n=1 Tax=Gigantopelta aegis TaxID=1735272 RepID=UPI001B889288|nr:plasminogen-like [Gigantopelta aegis]
MEVISYVSTSVHYLIILFMLFCQTKAVPTQPCARIVPYSYVACYNDFDVTKFDLYNVSRKQFHDCANDCAVDPICSSFLSDSRHDTCSHYRPKSTNSDSSPEQRTYLKYETQDKCISEPEIECCSNVDGSGMYTGRKVTTKSGLACQRWDQNSPQVNAYTNPAIYPESSLQAAENFCLALDHPEPWCYTMDPAIKWQSCGITRCVTN